MLASHAHGAFLYVHSPESISLKQGPASLCTLFAERLESGESRWKGELLERVDAEARMQYIREMFAPEDDTLRAIRERAYERGLPKIHVDPAEGRMLQWLLATVRARRVVEIGTLGGYSGAWMARALPEGGRLISVEYDPEHAEVARESFREAGLADRVEVRVGRAPGALESLTAEGPFDAVFIDADKPHYADMLAWATENVRLGGLVMAHNAFRRDRVLDPAEHDDPDVRGVRTFNRHMAEDPRLDSVIIPIGDGIAAAIRIG
jgi:caffeoyl-CoA O-methyltransferase